MAMFVLVLHIITPPPEVVSYLLWLFIVLLIIYGVGVASRWDLRQFIFDRDRKCPVCKAYTHKRSHPNIKYECWCERHPD